MQQWTLVVTSADWVITILTAGAIVGIRCKKLHKTCLHYAVEGGHTQIAAKLLLAYQQQQLQLDPQEEQSM